MENMTAMARLSRRSWFPYFCIISIIFVLYFKVIAFRLTNLDDTRLIGEAERFLHSGKSITSIFRQPLLIGTFDHYYRPMLSASLLIDTYFSGGDFLVFHLTNLLLHIAASCLIFILLREFSFNKEYSLFASLIFAVHPALSQAVAWISGRNDSLLAIFVFSAFIFLAEYMKSRRPVFLVLHLLSFVFALFTKESAVACIPLFLMYVILTGQTPARGAYFFLLCAVWAGAITSFLYARASAEGLQSMSAGSITGSLFQSLPALIQYVGKAFFPFNLSVRPYKTDIKYFYGIVSIVLIGAGVITSSKINWKKISFGLGWFLLFLIPSLISQSNYYEHRLYVPLAGLLFILPEMSRLTRLIPGLPAYKYLRPAGMFILVLFFQSAFRHSDSFMNAKTFWENAALTSPSSLEAHNALGDVYFFDHNLYELAEKEYQKCVIIAPANFDARLKLGTFYISMGRLKEAEGLFTAMLQNEHSYKGIEKHMIYFQFARIRSAQKRFNEAIDFYKAAIALNPLVIDYYKELIEICRQEKKNDLSKEFTQILIQKAKREPQNLIFMYPNARIWLAQLLASGK